MRETERDRQRYSEKERMMERVREKKIQWCIIEHTLTFDPVSIFSVELTQSKDVIPSWHSEEMRVLPWRKCIQDKCAIIIILRSECHYAYVKCSRFKQFEQIKYIYTYFMPIFRVTGIEAAVGRMYLYVSIDSSPYMASLHPWPVSPSPWRNINVPGER